MDGVTAFFVAVALVFWSGWAAGQLQLNNDNWNSCLNKGEYTVKNTTFTCRPKEANWGSHPVIFGEKHE